jgi:hypothetical protein
MKERVQAGILPQGKSSQNFLSEIQNVRITPSPLSA